MSDKARSRDHGVSVGCGAALLATGGPVTLVLVVWAWTAANASAPQYLFTNKLFLAALALFVLMFLTGLWALASPQTGWWMPPVREDAWKPWRIITRFRIRVSIGAADPSSRPRADLPATAPIPDPLPQSQKTTRATQRRHRRLSIAGVSEPGDDLDDAQEALLRKFVAAHGSAPRAQLSPFRCRPAQTPGIGPLAEPPSEYLVSHAGLAKELRVSRYDLEALERAEFIRVYQPPLGTAVLTPGRIGSFDIEPSALTFAPTAPVPPSTETERDYDAEIRAEIGRRSKVAFRRIQLDQGQREAFEDLILNACKTEGWKEPEQLSVNPINPQHMELGFAWTEAGHTITNSDFGELRKLARARGDIARQIRDTALGRIYRETYEPPPFDPGIL